MSIELGFDPLRHGQLLVVVADIHEDARARGRWNGGIQSVDFEASFCSTARECSPIVPKELPLCKPQPQGPACPA
jgi:hypothetical protein